MQWYEATSKKLEVGHRYSHQELIKLLKSDYPHMRETSCHWAVCGMLKNGDITKMVVSGCIRFSGVTAQPYVSKNAYISSYRTQLWTVWVRFGRILSTFAYT